MDGRHHGAVRFPRREPLPESHLSSHSAPREWDAQAYDASAQPQGVWGAAVLDLLELRGDELVLEAGSGTGRDAALLLARFPDLRLIAVDGSERMLEQLRTRLANDLHRVVTVNTDLQLPLPIDGPVDTVYSVATFHWILDHDALFANLAAVLKPGGQLAVDCGGAGNVARVHEAVASIWNGPYGGGPWNFATVEDTRRRLAQAGFVDAEVSLVPSPAGLAPGEELESFLTSVVLGWHLEQLPSSDRRPFIKAVAAQIPEGEIDYVRLRINARRGSA